MRHGGLFDSETVAGMIRLLYDGRIVCRMCQAVIAAGGQAGATSGIICQKCSERAFYFPNHFRQ